MKGLNSSLKKSDLRQTILTNHVVIGAVLETRLRQDSWEAFLVQWHKGLNFQVVGNISHDKNCRILVFWDPGKVTVSVLHMDAQQVHCLLTPLDGKPAFLRTFIYAYNSCEKRKSLWQSLLHHHSSVTLPWLLIGDFNVVLDRSVKMHDISSPCQVTSKLCDFLSSTGLHDHKYLGQKFTWDNGHTFCKLDRALVNSHWDLPMPDALVTFLPTSISDHSLVLVQLFKATYKCAPAFGFNNFWAQDDGFLDLVKKHWSTPVYGCYMFQLVTHLSALKKDLKLLDKSKYAQLESKVKVAKEYLDNCQSALLSDPWNEEVKLAATQALDDYIVLRNNHLSLLQQQAKTDWLTEGDMNSRFYHAQIAQRRRQNNIFAQ